MLALLWAQTSAHCFDVAKKTLLSENTYDILTRADPKTLPTKIVKKLVRAPLLSELPYDSRTLGSFVHIFWRCKKRPLLSENTYDVLTRAGPKTLPKKVPKTSFGGHS